MRTYILVGQEPVPVPVLEWSDWYQKNYRDRHVANVERDGVRVSTVFLGLDHGFGDGPPEIFETMIFGGPHDQDYMTRCATWTEAEAMHKAAMKVAFP